MAIIDEYGDLDYHYGPDSAASEQDKMESLRTAAFMFVIFLLIGISASLALIIGLLFCFIAFPFESVLCLSAVLALTALIMFFHRRDQRERFGYVPSR